MSLAAAAGTCAGWRRRALPSPASIESLETRLDPALPVAVLCHAGVRSWHFGCWLMQQKGFPQVWNLQGGIDAWSDSVDGGVLKY